MSATRVAIVTGGNKGIGFAITKGLCEKFQGDVYLTARDETRGHESVKKLESEGFKPKFHQLDIDNEESIQKLKQFMQEKYGGIDVLVNNAGIAFKGSSTAPVTEQAEKTVGTNYKSTKKVCDILFPLLNKHARVVNVTSSEGKVSHIPNEEIRKQLMDPNLTEEKLEELVEKYLSDVRAGVHVKNGWAGSTYRMSKIALNALTFIQQHKLSADKDKDIVINAVHPGYVDTDMTSHKGPLTIEQGAAAPLYLALLPPNVDSPRGEFVWHDKKVTDWAS